MHKVANVEGYAMIVSHPNNDKVAIVAGFTQGTYCLAQVRRVSVCMGLVGWHSH